MDRYRILSLDGGGSWALIEVMALMDLYGGDTKGHAVLSDFDMVVANSGGSIVLGCLVENMALGEVLNFFLSEQKRKSVFVREFNPAHDALRLAGIGPKYETTEKLTGLEAALPQRGKWYLPDAARDIPAAGSGLPVHLLVTAFDYDLNRAHFFRSAPATRPGWGVGAATHVYLAETIHASSNAPVNFFNKPAVLASDAGRRYWDGGIGGLNNPVLAAVTEAIVLGIDPQSIRALTLGTGTLMRPLAQVGQAESPLFEPRSKTGLTNDLEKLATSIVDDPPDAANFEAHVMTGGPLTVPGKRVDSRVVRMSPMISPLPDPGLLGWRLPDEFTDQSFEALSKLALDAVNDDEVAAIHKLASLWLGNQVRNQPIRPDAHLGPELGHEWHRDARAAWLAIR